MVIDHFKKSGKTACFISVPPTQTFHLVETDGDSRVTSINHAASLEYVDQRRLLRLPERNLSTTSSRAKTWLMRLSSD